MARRPGEVLVSLDDLPLRFNLTRHRFSYILCAEPVLPCLLSPRSRPHGVSTMKLLLLLLLLSLTLPLLAQEVVTWKPDMGHVYQNGRYLAYAKNPSGTSTVTTFSTAASGRI